MGIRRQELTRILDWQVLLRWLCFITARSHCCLNKSWSAPNAMCIKAERWKGAGCVFCEWGCQQAEQTYSVHSGTVCELVQSERAT